MMGAMSDSERVGQEKSVVAETVMVGPSPVVPGGMGGEPAHYDMIDAIRRGENVEPTVHEELGAIDSVIHMNDFKLWYGAAQAIHGISMSVPRGAVTALIGPSGCGKSTLLRSINRMNDLIDGVRVEGGITLNGAAVYEPTVDVIELRKRLGMVFQKPNPFPMSIFENVVYPLRIDGERRKSVLAEACERSLKSAAIWDEVKDRLRRGVDLRAEPSSSSSGVSARVSRVRTGFHIGCSRVVRLTNRPMT